MTETGVVEVALDPTDGTFVEPTAVSPDWLEIKAGPSQQSIFVPKGRQDPDLSYYHFGRSGVQYPSASTRVGVELAGLDWHTGDSLQVVTPNVGLAIHDLEAHFDYPAGGATRVTGAAMDWAQASAPLLDSSRGDVTWVAQMTAHRQAAGGEYAVLTRAGVARDFTIADGGSSQLAATLAPVAQDRALALHWKGRQYAALAAQAGPDVRPAAAPALAIRTLPAALARNNSFYNRYYMYLPSLVDFGPVAGGADFDQELTYGNPFATPTGAWTELVTLVYAMPVTVPGGGVTDALVIQATPVDALADGVLAPVLSPVRNVKVNGVAVDRPRAGVGPAPTVTWDAPTLGTPTNYAVTVQRVVSGELQPVGTFYTTGRSLTLPDAPMQMTLSYVLTVTAITAADRDLSARPFLGTLPYASTDYVTARITR